MNVPVWARDVFPKRKDWNGFKKDLMWHVHERDKTATLDEEAGTVALTIDGDPMTLRLANIAQLYAAEEEVFHLLDEWVDVVIGQMKAARVVDALPWEKVAPMLRVILYAPDQLDPTPLLRELAEELVMTVVVDYELSIVSITEKPFAAWNQTVDAVFERAIANTRDNTIALDPRDADIPAPISLCTGESPYHSAAAYLSLEKLATGKHGTLVMFPSRHGLVFLPISKKVSRELLDNYINGGFVMYEKTPRPLSNLLYSYEGGTLVPLPVADGDDAFVVGLPAHISKHIVD